MSQYLHSLNRLDQPISGRSEVIMFSDKLTPSGSLLDAFGRIRVSSPSTIFDSQSVDADTNKWSNAVNGTANTEYVKAESTLNMNVGTASGDYAYSQTTRVMAYQPGKSFLTMMTFAFNAAKVGLRQRVGIFDTGNGVFLEQDGETLNLVLRSSVSGTPVETKVAQADWNVDTFEGNGLSAQSVDRTFGEATLDTTKANIFWCDIEWLGVGDVRCGFIVDGVPVVAHVFHNDNRNTSVYMTTACLPLRYEIENTAITASASTMKRICATAISEGGIELTGECYNISRNSLTLGLLGTETPILSTRLKTGFDHSVAVPEEYGVFVESNDTIRYNIYCAPSLVTDGSWSSLATNSAIEYNNTMTAANTSGTHIMRSGFASRGESIVTGDIKSLIGQYSKLIDGTPVEMLMTITALSNNPVIHATGTWVELI